MKLEEERERREGQRGDSYRKGQQEIEKINDKKREKDGMSIKEEG